MSLEPRVDQGVPGLTAQVVRSAFPKGTLAMRIRDAIGPLYTDAQFAGAFSSDGSPAASPAALALVHVLAYAENLSDRQAADQVRARMDWKYLLGLELTDSGFDYSVLSEFRARLVEHGIEEKILEAVLAACTRQGLLRRGGRARTDSTQVLAAVAQLNRMEFVGQSLKAALEALAAAHPAWLAAHISAEVAQRYVDRIDTFRFPKGADSRQRWLVTVGVDGFGLLDAVHADGPDWLTQVPAVQRLQRAWDEQYLRDEQGVRPRQGKDLPAAADRLASPYDPDARYGLKRGSGWTGYKVHLSETCDPDLPHLITNVITTDATVTDTECTAQTHQQLADKDLPPGVHAVDAGYTSAAHIVAAHQRGIDLLGPVAADTTRQGRSHDGCDIDLSQRAFAIDWQARTATCPAGRTSANWYQHRKPNGTILTRVQFAAADCNACPLRAACTEAANGRYGRSLTLLPQEQQQVLDQRRSEQTTDAWRQRYKIRAGVEGTISQAVRRTGIRRTRYIGHAKTHLGHLTAATAINIVRLDAHLAGCSPGTTRTTHLARLAMALAA